MANRIEILYRNDYFCVINKESGHIVHKTRGGSDFPIILQSLRDQLGLRVYPIHRLDRGTSGCLVFAFSAEIVEKLQLALREGQKKYQALCLGMLKSEGQLNRELTGESGSKQKALTTYRVIQEFQGYSLLELEIFTGRKHQIRRHLSHEGHHIIGDVKYGKGWLNRKFRAKYNFYRMFLHSHFLSFTDPLTGDKKSFYCNLPLELKNLIKSLEG